MRSGTSDITRRSFVATGLARLVFWKGAAGAKSKAPAGMVLVSGGTYMMGTDGAEIDKKYGHFGSGIRAMLKCETPRHEETVAGFFMDRHEVTNRQFHEFVRARPQWRKERIPPEYHNGNYLKHWDGGRFPPGAADHPVVYVSWFAAMAYAEWAGKRLPLESEWEYAARGGLRAAEYPWGDEPPSPALANFSGSNLGGVVPVGRYRPNGFGLFDMAGNAWEYCLDPWRCSYGEATESTGEALAQSLITGWHRVRTRRVIRGGSWGGAPVNLRVAFRDSHPPEGAGPHVGFRCVLPAHAAAATSVPCDLPPASASQLPPWGSLHPPAARAKWYRLILNRNSVREANLHSSINIFVAVDRARPYCDSMFDGKSLL